LEGQRIKFIPMKIKSEYIIILALMVTASASCQGDKYLHTPGGDAVVIFFGRAMGYIGGGFIDVHGAGCQRTDPKTGEPTYGFGPQGDVRRVYNYVRLVRGE
jgi:hypothetical protein